MSKMTQNKDGENAFIGTGYVKSFYKFYCKDCGKGFYKYKKASKHVKVCK